LKDVGLSETQSHCFQTIAHLPDAEFEQHIADTIAEGPPLTSAGVYREAKRQAAPLDLREQDFMDSLPENEHRQLIELARQDREEFDRESDLDLKEQV